MTSTGLPVVLLNWTVSTPAVLSEESSRNVQVSSINHRSMSAWNWLKKMEAVRVELGATVTR